ncbi:MAG: alanine/glycine:cation symporter family protein [Planctomycetota bacterium]|jgi:AGCS family alanine or glycine:cation symporter
MLVLLGWAGLIGCEQSGELSVFSTLNPNTVLTGQFDTALYSYSDNNTLDVILVEGPVDSPAQAVHMQMVWAPRPGRTPIDHRATNSTIRYIIFTGEQTGIYAGAGYLFPILKPGGETFKGSMRNSALRLKDATEGFEDRLGLATAEGDFTAHRDDAAALQLLRSVQLRLANQLGYPRFIDTGGADDAAALAMAGGSRPGPRSHASPMDTGARLYGRLFFTIYSQPITAVFFSATRIIMHRLFPPDDARFASRLFLIALLGLALVGADPAWAQDAGAEEVSIQQQVDTWFADNLAGPMAKVLMYPLFPTPTRDVFSPTTDDAREGDDFENHVMRLKTSLDEQGVITYVAMGDDDTATLSTPVESYEQAAALLNDRSGAVLTTALVWAGENQDADQAYQTLSADGLERIDRIDLGDDQTGLRVEFEEHDRAAALLEAAGLTPTGKPHTGGLPIIVLMLMFGGVFFTFRYGFVNLRLFVHAIHVIRGKYDKPEDEGEVSHFQALTSALSATVGLGNIGGVAVAISTGGPGAVFWMWFIALFGMSSKFSSCSFAQLYRRVDENGHVLGGPMVYLDQGIREQYPSLAVFGKLLAVAFSVLTVFAAFGGGNMYQANQTYAIIQSQFLDGNSSEAIQVAMPWVVGIILAFLAGLVIIGGIKRIGHVTSKLVPFMCGFYCVVCLVIILINVDRVPAMFTSIFADAMTGRALFGGFAGILVIGATRAAFSNEAGLGSAAIAHSAAKTDEPIREGVVAMVGPFIDTIVVCTMTALAILITNAHLNDSGLPYAQAQGVQITAKAFASLGGAVPYILTIAVFIFAYSTVVSWCYYGERAVEYLFGRKGIMPYRVVYVFVIILGPVLSLDNVIGFADMMLLSMAFPNILGMILLSSKLKGLSDDYIKRLKSGEIKPTHLLHEPESELP